MMCTRINKFFVTLVSVSESSRAGGGGGNPRANQNWIFEFLVL